MIDRVDAAAHRIENAVAALGVACAGPVETMPFGDPGRHLFGAVVGVLGIDARCHDAAGGHDLDEVAARVDLLAHGADNVLDAVGYAADAVAVASGHTDQSAGRGDGRSGLALCIASIPYGELEVILAAAIADRRHPARQRRLGVL